MSMRGSIARKGIPLFSFAPVFLISGLSATCNEPPPCTDKPESMIGQFDGVLYDENSGGQMFANWSDVCINVHDEVTYQYNIDYMQTVIIMDTVNGLDVYYIFFADFKNPVPYWEGGVELIVKVQAAIDSARYDTPIVLDGQDAVGYYWEDNFWDSRNNQPGYVTSAGSITFSVASKVPGGMVDAVFDASVIPHSATAVPGELPAPRRAPVLQVRE